MIRQVVLDTETTGFDPAQGDRIVEIGCLELINHVPTENSFQTLINPQRPMSAGASEVTGITDDMLVDKPLFEDVYQQFLEFIGEDELIIHNAQFDLKFLNAELERVCDAHLGDDRAFCTLTYARKKFPGSPASLDALCRRFDIDLSSRSKHGALIDSFLLADVYLALIGGRQHGLVFDAAPEVAEDSEAAVETAHRRSARPQLLGPTVSKEEAMAHAAFVLRELGEKPMWQSLGLISEEAEKESS